MKYKVSLNDSIDLIVVADSEIEAVNKARDVKDAMRGLVSVKDESIEEKIRKAQEWVDYDIKTYGEVSEETKKTIESEGLTFDKWNNQVHDAVEYRQFGDVRVSDKGGQAHIGWASLGLVTVGEARKFLRDLQNAIEYAGR